eukprot:1863213-Amphidinium_carterae.1
MLEHHTRAMMFAVEFGYRMWKDNVADHVAIRKAAKDFEADGGSDSRGRKRGGSKIVKWDPP